MTGGSVAEHQARAMFASLVEATRTINRSAKERKLEKLGEAIDSRGKIIQEVSLVAEVLQKAEEREYLSAVQEMDHETQILIEQYKQEILRNLRDLNRNKAVLQYSK